ncbi:histidinol-phosphate transaminase [Oscillospiraceae bacterium NSJ-54]|uniref:Histidinol-phosphate aminotransferase n=2 Tax=Zongyangia hominis TaxID=2763677 RepID=A0A926E9G8_9FIRM|nr:histidinol-phosphate transaminase [Zongyangia hominis]
MERCDIVSYQLGQKIRELKPYDPISGQFEVRLDANESFFPVDGKLLEEMKAALARVDFHRYPDPYAVRLIEGFAAFYGVSPDHVTAGNGSDELIGVITSSFLEKGDVIVTLSPDFSMYRFYASIYEVKNIDVSKEGSLKIDVDEAIARIREAGARMVIFSNPCNPTSLGLSKEDVHKLVTSVDALVVVDEAYMDFWDQSILSQAHTYENVIVLRTCSKALGMAALRLGFAVACDAITTALRAVKSPYNVNSISQEMGTVLFSHPDLIEKRRDAIIASRVSLEAGLRALSDRVDGIECIYPSCTNFVFVRMKDAKAVFERLLSMSVAVRLMGNHLRISAGSEQENEKVLRCLEAILQ